MAKISIIIPVYNVEEYLRQCLDSVVNQTFKDLEIICVNDCSSDNSAEILNEYAKKDNRIKIISMERNLGLGNVRNIALKEVTSDYVMFLDSDDWLELNTCELVYNKISANNNDFVYFNYYKYFDKNKICYDKNKFKVLLKLPDIDNINPSNLKEPFICSSECWFKIYSMDFIRKNNLQFLVGQMFEDQLFYSKAFCLANSISVVNKPLIYYRQRKTSICYNSSFWKDVPKSWDYILNNIPNSTSQVCKDSIILNSINSLLFWFKRYKNIEPSIGQMYYQNMHLQFKKYDDKVINRLNKHLNITTFNLIRNIKTYKMYKFINFLIHILGFEFTKTHICLYIMGFGIHIRRK